MLNPMEFALAALACCVAGVLAGIAVPAAFGRTLGFLALGVAGSLAGAAAVEQLHAGTVFFAGVSSLHTTLRVDATGSFFIGIIGVVAVLVGIYGLGTRNSDERRTGRTASASACAVLLASLLACLANDVLLFLFAWELLALSFFWAIAFAGTDPDAPRAAYLTVMITHAAGACLVGALLVLAHLAGSYAVDAAVAAAKLLAPLQAGIILLLLLVGFGAKFGMLPLQAWLPYGYSAAPSAVAALMAGGALNAGFYGIVRFVLPLANIPVWFAIVAVALGALCAFFGITWATGEADARRLAAYSSVENGGIILAAFGVALGGRAIGSPTLVGLGVAAAFMQIVAHALAKATLFLGCSTLADRCSTTSLNRLGGVAKSMPVTAIATLAAALSLAALPPLAGFAGEWLVLEGLMQAFRTASVSLEVAFALAGALIGVSAGIAVVAFTKVVGSGLLGAARSPEVATATETPSLCKRAALSLGALAILTAGLFAPQLLAEIGPAVDGIAHASVTHGIVAASPLLQPAFAGFSSASPLGLALVIAGFTLLFWGITRLLSRRAGARSEVWTSGEAYRPWTQYTGTGYVNATRVILDAGMRTAREIAADQAAEVSQSVRYRSTIRPFFDLPFYRAIAKALFKIADAVRSTQSGIIAAYLTYILVFTIVLLILFPSIRHW